MVGHDFRYALRSLGKNRAFTAIAVITLALGVGANTAIFSVVYGILLEPLPYAEPERLVMVWENDLHNSSPREGASNPDLRDFREQNRSFEQLGAWAFSELNLIDPSRPPERVTVFGISPNLFPMLGIPPQTGRLFTAEHDRVGAERVVLLTDEVWQTRYNRDPRILGSKITLDGNPYTILGVMPRDPIFPATAQLWIPLQRALEPFNEQRGVHNVIVAGRLKSGVSIEQAQSEMSAIAQRLEKQYPDYNVGRGVFVEPLHEAAVGRIRRPLVVLLVAVLVVLLIACTNVAGLLLARATARAREVAIRTSLGATRWRLIRQLLAESLVLALAGGLGGLALAFWGIDVLMALSPENLPRASSVKIDLPVLLFTAAVSLASALLFGLFPAIHASRAPLTETLKAGSRQVAGRIRGGARTILVVSEIALAVVLVIGAGLLIRSFWRLLNVDPGFRAQNVLVLDVKLAEGRYPSPSREVYPKWPEVTRFYDELLERVGAIPGVRSAAIALNHPLSSGWTSQVAIVGRPEPTGPVDEVRMRPVTPGYFATVGVPIKRGRDIQPGDRAEHPWVVLVNEAFVRKYFPNEDPIGKSVQFWGKPRQIVGVVGDVRFMGPDQPSEPALYQSLYQLPMNTVSLVVHTAVKPTSVTAPIREAVGSIDRELAVYNVSTLQELLHEAVGAPRFQMMLLTIFGSIALLLAAVGIYGVISYRVNQRTQEIGVRLALGARHEQILRLVVGEGAALAAAGVAIGVTAGFAVTRYMSALLYEISTRDLVTFVVVAVILGIIAIAASYVPARRAMRVEPMAALRYE